MEITQQEELDYLQYKAEAHSYDQNERSMFRII